MPWTLTSPAFERLLTRLDEDRDRAAIAYEQLRRRIIALMHWWGVPHAEGLADETLDRVARKLEEGADVAPASLGAYVRGVARMVFLEAQRRPMASVGELTSIPAATDGAADALACLESCLSGLDHDDRALILEYYGDGKPADVRRRLATRLGVSSVALRIRAHRLREQLERCVRACEQR